MMFPAYFPPCLFLPLLLKDGGSSGMILEVLLSLMMLILFQIPKREFIFSPESTAQHANYKVKKPKLFKRVGKMRHRNPKSF